MQKIHYVYERDSGMPNKVSTAYKICATFFNFALGETAGRTISDIKGNWLQKSTRTFMLLLINLSLNTLILYQGLCKNKLLIYEVDYLSLSPVLEHLLGKIWIITKTD